MTTTFLFEHYVYIRVLKPVTTLLTDQTFQKHVLEVKVKTSWLGKKENTKVCQGLKKLL